MSAKSRAKPSPPSTSLPPASPAKISQRLAMALELMAHGLASGERWPASLASYDPASSSWRTSQRSLLGGSEPFSGNWPRSGTIAGGTAYPLPPLAPLTRGTAGSASRSGEGLAWPTPDASLANYGEDPASFEERRERLKEKGINGNGAGTPLAVAVRMEGDLWPTPVSSDGTAGARQPDGKRGAQLRDFFGASPTRTCEGLPRATPRASDGRAKGDAGGKMESIGRQARREGSARPTPTVHGNNNRKGISAKAGDGLATAAKQESWPTPRASDYRSGRTSDATAEKNSRPLCEATERAAPAGRLSPEWVECLMGFPPGWTALPGEDGPLGEE